MQRRHVFSSMGTLFGPRPSLVMQDIIETVERVAVSDLGVLITGEPGTGKKWLAHLLHNFSGRHEKDAVMVDCSSCPPDEIERVLFGSEQVTFSENEVHCGILEKTAGGTLILHRISELPEPVQIKIIRAIEHQDFHRLGGKENIRLSLRLIATVQRTFGETQAPGELGKEIYHRICPITINLPPLRERRDDIPFLIEHRIGEAAIGERQRPRGITASALKVCLKYPWPGNVRELQHVVVEAVKNCPDQFIGRKHLPEYLYRPQPKDANISSGMLAS